MGSDRERTEVAELMQQQFTALLQKADDRENTSRFSVADPKELLQLVKMPE